ncbi:hypothetical protein ACFW9L_07595 [Streptomyces sp. NPDC059517]
MSVRCGARRGIGLDGSYGAADVVSWYDGHPDVPRTGDGVRDSG